MVRLCPAVALVTSDDGDDVTLGYSEFMSRYNTLDTVVRHRQAEYVWNFISWRNSRYHILQRRFPHYQTVWVICEAEWAHWLNCKGKLAMLYPSYVYTMLVMRGETMTVGYCWLQDQHVTFETKTKTKTMALKTRNNFDVGKR